MDAVPALSFRSIYSVFGGDAKEVPVLLEMVLGLCRVARRPAKSQKQARDYPARNREDTNLLHFSKNRRLTFKGPVR